MGGETHGGTRLRDELQRSYHEGQAVIASKGVYEAPQSMWPYYEANYRRTVSELPKGSMVVEVGTGHGSLLAWLRSLGFSRVEGVDASPGDVTAANRMLGAEVVALGDGETYLRARPCLFDFVVMKAVLEHLPKDRLLPMLGAIAAALGPNGTALIEVPNMDWLAASHERYMDLTHEVGFTRESLRTLLLLVFTSVEIRGSQPGGPSRTQRWFRRPLVWLLRRIFYVVGEGASDVLFESRSLIAIARDPKLTD